jgi:hypothetical protein
MNEVQAVEGDLILTTISIPVLKSPKTTTLSDFDPAQVPDGADRYTPRTLKTT